MAVEIGTLDLEQVDKEVRAWAQITQKQLITRLLQLGLNDKVELQRGFSRIRPSRSRPKSFDREPPLITAIRNSVKKRAGWIEYVAFQFPRHGIFLQHGVGRHRPVGSPAAKSAAKPWLTDVLPDAIDALSYVIAEQYADVVVSFLRLRINGIIDISTK